MQPASRHFTWYEVAKISTGDGLDHACCGSSDIEQERRGNLSTVKEESLINVLQCCARHDTGRCVSFVLQVDQKDPLNSDPTVVRNDKGLALKFRFGQSSPEYSNALKPMLTSLQSH